MDLKKFTIYDVHFLNSDAHEEPICAYISSGMRFIAHLLKSVKNLWMNWVKNLSHFGGNKRNLDKHIFWFDQNVDLEANAIQFLGKESAILGYARFISLSRRIGIVECALSKIAEVTKRHATED